MGPFSFDVEGYLCQHFGMSRSSAEVLMLLWRATKSIRLGRGITIKDKDFIEFCDAWTIWQRHVA